MICKFARLSMFGRMALLVPLSLAGCLAQEPGEAAGDESAGDGIASNEIAGDELANGEIESDVAARVEAGTSDLQRKNTPSLVEDSRIVTCNGGWPGGRRCDWVFESPTDILFPDFIAVEIHGHNGEAARSVTVGLPRTIFFTAVVHEGDVFNPGKHTTTYRVRWLRN